MRDETSTHLESETLDGVHRLFEEVLIELYSERIELQRDLEKLERLTAARRS